LDLQIELCTEFPELLLAVLIIDARIIVSC